MAHYALSNLKVDWVRWRHKGSKERLQCLSFEFSNASMSPEIGAYADCLGNTLETDRNYDL